MKLFSKITVPLVLFLLFIWQILLTFQGLDLADTGFQLSAFRFIFDDPYSVQYCMMYWLSDVCGFLWMHILPGGGLFWSRMGWVVLLSIAFILYLKQLIPIFGSRNAVFSLSVTYVFILLGGPECLNYDIFTALGFAVGFVTIYRGLIKEKSDLLLLSGIVFGMSFFFKLSNLSALAFFLLIPFFSILNGEKISIFLKKSLFWLTGFGLGITIIILLIVLSGHFDLFLNNLKFVSEMGNDIQSTHGLKTMLLSYLSGYFNAFVMMAGFLMSIWIYFRYADRSLSPIAEMAKPVFLILISLLSILLTILLKDIFWSKIRYLFIGLMILQGFVVVADKNVRKDLRLLSFAGLIMLIIVPLGSDSGLDKSIWGMWLLGPVLLAPTDKTSFLFRAAGERQVFLKKALILVVLVTAMVHAWQTPYFDTGSRLKKTVAIDHPKLRYIYTTAKRATVISELVTDGFPKISNEKYLLAFIEIPMVNYLSDKIPFISTSWPKLYYNPEKFKLKLEEALLRRKEFPAIIRQKQNTMLVDWPVAPDPEYLNYPENLSKWPEHGKILNEFIAKNDYQVVWENAMFQVLLKK
jgi:hypothetical protein